jgi:phosphomannomutase
MGKAIQIKFGTDGWRAIIAKEYTVDNVIRVAEATGRWMLGKGFKSAVVGHDCRFAGPMFAETTATVLASLGIRVSLAKGFVSTPMVSLGVVKLGAEIGVVITASHNPPSYNGFKLKSAYGGPTIPADISAVEALIPDQSELGLLPFDTLINQGLIRWVDLEKMYLQHIEASFDMQLLKQVEQNLVYDAMYGAGQRVMRQLFPNAMLLHCEDNPGFMGQAPEPIHKNLSELSETLKNHEIYTIGLANDGDADRIGMYDEDGNFVDSHKILLLLLYYLYHHKNLRGKVIITFSVSDKMVTLAKKLGLEYEVTKIGFKYIAEIMTKEDVLVGGEESGGLAVKGHIPERDGIWCGLLIMEFMAKTGKSLKQLIQLIYDEVGTFCVERDDHHLDESLKQSIIQKCASDHYKAFGPYTIINSASTDGYKFYFENGSWVMIRPSGTEPLLRVYAEAANESECRAILDAVKQVILAD